MAVEEVEATLNCPSSKLDLQLNYGPIDLDDQLKMS